MQAASLSLLLFSLLFSAALPLRISGSRSLFPSQHTISLASSATDFLEETPKKASKIVENDQFQTESQGNQELLDPYEKNTLRENPNNGNKDAKTQRSTTQSTVKNQKKGQTKFQDDPSLGGQITDDRENSEEYRKISTLPKRDEEHSKDHGEAIHSENSDPQCNDEAKAQRISSFLGRKNSRLLERSNGDASLHSQKQTERNEADSTEVQTRQTTKKKERVQSVSDRFISLMFSDMQASKNFERLAWMIVISMLSVIGCCIGAQKLMQMSKDSRLELNKEYNRLRFERALNIQKEIRTQERERLNLLQPDPRYDDLRNSKYRVSVQPGALKS